MKIVLIGYMASGKSAVGRLVAHNKKLNFIDLDDYIENEEQMSISTIFEVKGEIYFRNKEREYLSILLNNDADFVLSLGGGTPCYGNNMKLILEKSKSYYLKTSIETIYNRLISEKNKRPLVASIALENLKEFIAKHLFERAPFYTQASQTISTDQKTIEELAELI